jgi:dipeptidyl aminopeptidase/acylaminoacyl peptidase
MVLLVHGGPWWKDSFGFNPAVQLLANRGYSVLQVNYRGSTGYGKRFMTAGNREWGRAMQDDLSTAVIWARESNVSEPTRVAIMGQSYGGYATLAGLAFTPDLYRCGVDAFGPSNLVTLLSSIPPYWEAEKAEMFKRVGDPGDPIDKDLLTQASPLFSAENVKAPLLIAQGANDPRVKPSESEAMFQALEKRGVPATYVLYADEGHGFARAENRLDYFARVDGFLGKCLGGKTEPMPKEGKVEGSTAVVKTAAGKK